MFSKRVFVSVFVVTGLSLFGAQAHAQSVFSEFGSADGVAALQYPATVPNNAQPEAAIHNITGFDRTFGFGSSSTNTRRADGNINAPSSPGGVFTEVNSNGHAIYIELFSPLIGALNGRGSSFPTATNLADGGSTSTTALMGSPAGLHTQHRPRQPAAQRDLHAAAAGRRVPESLRHLQTRRHRCAVVGHQRHQH
jgi:hypothetical protein